MIKQAVILAGGQGKRLQPLTLKTPKPLIKIYGKPFLEYIIENLKENGIDEIILLTGYMGEKIEKYFGDGLKFGVKIKYSHSAVECLSGTRIKNALSLIDKQFLLLYCDNYYPLNLNLLVKEFKKHGSNTLITIYKNLDNYTKNNVYLNENGLVEIYDKERKSDKLNGVEIGFMIINKSIFNSMPRENISFQDYFFPKLIKSGKLYGFMTEHKYYGLSNLNRIPEIKKYLTPKKIVLLDRDGVINKKPLKADYVKTIEEFILLPHTIDALKILTQKNYKIFIITNQAGISRGIMNKDQLKNIHKHFLRICRKNNIKISKIYYCPHGWYDNCDCRKPNPGMLFQAARDYYFDLTKAIFIGDDKRDLLTGKNAQCKTILVTKNNTLYNVAVKL